ncbi:MAG TPA: Gfo/Idh/MocA family oxidoreductase [Phenylobacterium sp.]|uniref:Gfo/Idh/MocA family protein n=1 Tax=Phenylobacterium sp. TaxID=1871053 RepID=UPI002B4914B3|nr:Gfo/Idh/MocA family oxidoreductase [Phenylobacterium sp.]HKR88782.1 Gfo/Idh/MocA family oxidoreductase [Phenylobacterium sp.]
MLNIGVIGYGYWGPNLVRNFSELDGCQVTAVADLDPAKIALVKRRYPTLHATTDIEEVLAAPDIDAVVIATPVRTHYSLAMQALRHGKDVWLEKPMTETADQARRLVDEAERRGRLLHVDHTFVYTGAVRKMREIIAGGDLGQMLYYDATRVNLGLFQHDVNVISDLAVHDFAILDYLLDEAPASVTASGTSHYPGTPENLAHITLYYDSGAIAHIGVNWLAPVKVRQVLVGGSKKMIVYDDLQPSEKVKVYDTGVSFATDPTQIHQMRVGYRTGDMCAPKLDGGEALSFAAQHFVECATSRRPTLTSGEAGLRIVEIIEAATLSMRGRGRAVRIEPVEVHA